MVGLGITSGFEVTEKFQAINTSYMTFSKNIQPSNVTASVFSRVLFSKTETKIIPTSFKKNLSSKDSGYGNKYNLIRAFSQKMSKGIGEVTKGQENKRGFSVQRETICNRCNKVNNKLGRIIQPKNDVSIYGKLQTKRRLNGNIVSRFYRTDDPFNHNERRKMIIGVFLLIDLGCTPFKTDWTTQILNPSYVDSLEDMILSYRRKVYRVLKLLDHLRFSGKSFRVVSRNAEMRIYFPSSANITNKSKAIEYLKRFDVEKDDECYKIVVEETETSISLNSNVSINHQFRDLRRFLDHTESSIKIGDSIFNC